VVRVSQEFENRSSLGAIFINRQGDGSIIGEKDDDYNRTYALDGSLGIGKNGAISGFLAKTRTPGLDGRDHAFRISGEHSSEKWVSRINFTKVGANFNPEVGFLSRRDYRKLDMFALRRYRPKDWMGLHEIRPHIFYSTYRNSDDFHVSSFLHIDNHWEWESSFEMHTGMNFIHEGVLEPFEIVDGVEVPAGNYDDHEVVLIMITDQSAPLSAEIETRVGGIFGGDRVAFEPTLKYRIGETFSSELSWNHNDIDLGPGKDFTVDVARLRLSYSFTPKISLQALVQYDRRDDLLATNLRFAWLVSANTGFYLVYNEVDDSNLLASPRREFILKYSYMFDLLR
tara:strand:+ start:671 stop:1693 length:1023 start_codon:yes stop_codon:yes gene_type:complete